MGGVICIMDKWEEAKKKYILSGLTMAQIAEETGLSVNTLRKKCAKEKWKAERTKQGKKRAKKTIEKAVERASTRSAKNLNESLEEELALAKQIMQIIKKAIAESEQFSKHFVTYKGEKYNNGILYNQWVEEQEFSKLDVKSLAELTRTLEIVEGIHRRTGKQLTRLEEERLQIERERLAIEKERLQLAIKATGGLTEDEETGIVLLPSVDMEQYEREQVEFLKQYETENTEDQKGGME